MPTISHEEVEASKMQSSTPNDSLLFVLSGLWEELPMSSEKGVLVFIRTQMGSDLICWMMEKDLTSHEMDVLREATKRQIDVKEGRSTVGVTVVRDEIITSRYKIDYARHKDIYDLQGIESIAIGQLDSLESGNAPKNHILISFCRPLFSTARYVIEAKKNDNQYNLSEEQLIIEEIQTWLGLLNMVTAREEFQGYKNGINYSSIKVMSVKEREEYYTVKDARPTQTRKKPPEDNIDSEILKTTWGVLSGLSVVTAFIRDAADDIAQNIAKKSEGEPTHKMFKNVNKQNTRLSTEHELGSMSSDLNMNYETLIKTMKCTERRNRVPLSVIELTQMLGENGILDTSKEKFELAVFKRGLSPESRIVFWKYILGIYQYGSNELERLEVDKELESEYLSINKSWRDILSNTNSSDDSEIDSSPKSGNIYSYAGDDTLSLDIHENAKACISKIKKDVNRTYYTSNMDMLFTVRSTEFSNILSEDIHDGTDEDIHGGTDEDIHDRTGDSPEYSSFVDIIMSYSISDIEVGYVQGMCDLLAPFKTVMAHDYEAYGCFTKFMSSRGRNNFLRDESGMKLQLGLLEVMLKLFDPYLFDHLHEIGVNGLSFCFRLILLYLMREFGRDEIQQIWEVVWTCPMSRFYHLFMILAIVNKYRAIFMLNCTCPEDVTRVFNSLRTNVSAMDVIVRSEAISKGFILKFISEVEYNFDTNEAFDIIIGEKLFSYVMDVDRAESNTGGGEGSVDRPQSNFSKSFIYEAQSICTRGDLLYLGKLFDVLY